MDAIRSQWIRSQEELQSIRNENETLKRQVLESTKVAESALPCCIENNGDINSMDQGSGLVVVAAGSGDCDDDRGNLPAEIIQNENSDLMEPVVTAEAEAIITAEDETTSTEATITIPAEDEAATPASSDSTPINTIKSPLPSIIAKTHFQQTASPCSENIMAVQNQSKSAIIQSEDKNDKENTAPKSKYRVFRPVLL